MFRGGIDRYASREGWSAFRLVRLARTGSFLVHCVPIAGEDELGFRTATFVEPPAPIFFVCDHRRVGPLIWSLR